MMGEEVIFEEILTKDFLKSVKEIMSQIEQSVLAHHIKPDKLQTKKTP